MTKIGLNQITKDVALSPRIEEGTDAGTVEKYKESLDQMPAIVIYKVPDKDKYLLADGWHRLIAAESLGLESIEADVKYGTYKDAKGYALLANLEHGRPVTRKEKRYAIEEFMLLHPQRSNSWLAKDLGTTHKTVEKVRAELEASGKLPVAPVLYTQDGREYPRTIAQPKKEEPEPETPESEEETAPLDEPVIPESPPIPMLGIYELNQVHQADCLIGLAGLPEECIDLVFADPPYNLKKNYGGGSTDDMPKEQYFAWCMKWFMGAYRVLKPGGAFYVMHYPEVAAQWKQQLDQLFDFRHWITWVYPSNVGHSKTNWTRSHRTILYYTKGQVAHFNGEADPQAYKNPNDKRIKHIGKEGTTPYDWWEYNLVKNVSKDKTDWPNQLPIGLVHRIVVSSCPEDGIVCDPFMGSGTTATAAVANNRAWVGFDMQRDACEITMGRIRDEQEQKV